MILNSEKHKNFKRISTGRLQDIQIKLRLLSNLASNNYEFTREEVDSLFREIEKHLKFTKDAFEKRLKKLDFQHKTSTKENSHEQHHR